MYTHNYKHIGFNGGVQPTSQKLSEQFSSKEEFDLIHKQRVIWLANLDGVMNYCAYFKRDKGNIGTYERAGKSHKVNGEWDRYYILANYGKEYTPFLSGVWYENLVGFQSFLKENGWFDDSYFELMERYA